MIRMIVLAACITRIMIYEEDHKIHRCIVLVILICGSRNVWKNYRQKCLKAESICFCPVSYSSVIRHICVL